jgi:protein-S-isoprenylcysteine O-methyltransferase Ste14
MLFSEGNAASPPGNSQQHQKAPMEGVYAAMEQLIGHSDLQLRQKARKRRIWLMALLVAPFFLVTASAWPQNGMVGHGIEAFGAMLLLIAIFGRTWCTLYIGGRKRETLVTTGPYSVVRHPLYLFTMIGLVGLGLQTGSIIAALIVTIIVGWPLAAVTRHEEKVLAERFGPQHRTYIGAVPAFLPNFALWRSEATLEIKPALAERTFLEAALMLLAVPLAELVHALQSRDLLPVLIRLR